MGVEITGDLGGNTFSSTTWVVGMKLRSFKLDGKHLYLLNHLTKPQKVVDSGLESC